MGILELDRARKSLERLNAKIANNRQRQQTEAQTENISLQPQLSIDERWLFAVRKVQLGDIDAAIIALHQSLEINPNHAKTNLFLGSLLLTLGNIDGIDYLEAAMNVDPGCISDAISYIRQFAERISDPAVASECEAIANKYYQIWLNTYHQYVKFKPSDIHHKHRLSDETIAEIVTKILKIPQVEHIYITLKSMPEDILEQHNVFVNYSLTNSPNFDLEDRQKMLSAVEIALASIGMFSIFYFHYTSYYDYDPIVEKLRDIPKTCIYNRKKILAAMKDNPQ